MHVHRYTYPHIHIQASIHAYIIVYLHMSTWIDIWMFTCPMLGRYGWGKYQDAYLFLHETSEHIYLWAYSSVCLHIIPPPKVVVNYFSNGLDSFLLLKIAFAHLLSQESLFSLFSYNARVSGGVWFPQKECLALWVGSERLDLWRSLCWRCIQ